MLLTGPVLMDCISGTAQTRYCSLALRKCIENFHFVIAAHNCQRIAGKTTLLRDVVRMLADDFGRRVVVVATSNEIGGDGAVPHPCLGTARRMSPTSRAAQHEVLLEAVQNHTPEVRQHSALYHTCDCPLVTQYCWMCCNFFPDVALQLYT